TAKEVYYFIPASELRVLLADVARGDIGQQLHIHAVKNRRKQFLTPPEPLPDRNPDELARLVLVGFITQPDRGGFAAIPEDLFVEVGVEVKSEHIPGADSGTLKFGPFLPSPV